ncbi:MAG: hypothetical protein AB1414_04055 [bacterium]
MRRFILFLILFFGISFLFYITILRDFKPTTINISGYLSLEDRVSAEGVKVEVVPFYPKRIFRKPVQHFFTDSTGFYKLEEIEVPIGPLGEIFVLWLDGQKKKAPYLKLRIIKKGYLPVEVLIFKFTPIVKIPFLTLDKEGTRKPLNEVISENGIKIVKNITRYRFCALHNYLWFYPEYYDLELIIPTDKPKQNVKLKLRLINEPLYTNFEEELSESADELKGIIKILIPEIPVEEVKLRGGENVANSLSNPSLVDKLNEILINSKIKHIRLTSIDLVKKK